MLQYHPEAYVEYITPSLELVCSLCFSESPVAAIANSERFNVNILNLMKDILNNDSYRPQTLNVNGMYACGDSHLTILSCAVQSSDYSW